MMYHIPGVLSADELHQLVEDANRAPGLTGAPRLAPRARRLKTISKLTPRTRSTPRFRHESWPR